MSTMAPPSWLIFCHIQSHKCILFFSRQRRRRSFDLFPAEAWLHEVWFPPPHHPLSRTIWSKEQRGPRAFLHISCWIKCATLLCGGMQTLALGRSLYASKNSKKSPSVLCGVQSSSHEFQSKCMHGVVHGARVQRKTLTTEPHHLLFIEIRPCRRVENYI